MSVPDDPTEPTEPYPPRYWWLKRLLISGAILAAIYFATMAWWGWVVDQRIEAEMAAARARGEPTTAAEFAIPSVPDDQIAAITLQRAAETVTLTREQDYFIRQGFDVERLAAPENRAMLKSFVDAASEARPIVRAARSQSGADWKIRFDEHFSIHRLVDLRHTLFASAVDAHLRGDDHEAIELAGDLLHLARMIDRHPSPPSVHISCVITVRDAVDVVDLICREPHTADDAQAPSPQQLKALIDELLDDQEFHDAFPLAFFAWRVELRHTAETAELVGGMPTEAWMGRASFKVDALRLMRWYGAIGSATIGPDLPTALASVPPPITSDAELWRTTAVTNFSRPATLFQNDSIAPRVRQQYQALAWRRAAAINLAILLYKADHDGNPPARLAELPPGYIPRLPVDPLKAGGKTFDYSPDKGMIPLPVQSASTSSNP